MTTLEYFHGDELAASVWERKYRYKDEKTPDDSFIRYAKEIAHMKYEQLSWRNICVENYLSEYGKKRLKTLLTCSEKELELYYLDFLDYRKILLGGSMLATIGNHESYSSLSNCFVLGRPHDSYEGINQKTMEICAVMSRRGGAGLDLSSLRPNGAKIHNQANMSPGPILFAERYSNITSEVAIHGRRGALMLSMSIKHPDSIAFAQSKQDLTKITGANISVILDDDFMLAAQEDGNYYQHFPVDVPIYNFEFDSFPLDELTKVPYTDKHGERKNGYVRIIKAKDAWQKIIHCAWNTAEPGIIFSSNWYAGGTDGVYDRYKAVTTNPCSEIPMQPYDSCRLASMNLLGFVLSPYTDKAKFDWDLFYKVSYEQLAILDTLVDVEKEYINRIIEKIRKDKDEPQELKNQVIGLWEKIIKEGQDGRRCGAGFTALGDTLAALGLKYDNSKETMEFLEKLFKAKMKAELDASIDLAALYGPFVGFDWDLEFKAGKVNNIFRTIETNFPEQVERMKKVGRRNVSWSTAAPTGSLSILSQTTSGIEPLFLPYYMRRKKCITADERVDYIDPADGQKFTEFFVLHPQFARWIAVRNNVTIETVIEQAKNKELDEIKLNELFKESPWFGCCANDLDWEARVQIQGLVQKYTTHSISSTINLPNDIKPEIVANIYEKSWDEGLKGITVYRDGCRGGIFVSTNSKQKDDAEFDENRAPKRPRRLPAKYHTLKSKGKIYSVIIGFYQGKPYEIFITSEEGMPENLDDINDVIDGEIVKDFKNWYNFETDTFVLKDLGDVENDEKELSLLLSMSLRHRTPLKFIIKTLQKTQPIAGSFTHKLVKILSKYVNNGESDGEKCPDCGQELIYENGCRHCPHCGWSKC